MGVINGIAAAVNGANTVRKWSISTKADVQAYVASNTHGATGRLPGNEDWSGSFTGYGHTPPVMPGSALSFLGSIDGANGCSGTAIVDQVEVSIDIEGGKPVDWTCTFSGNGPLTFGAANVADATEPDPPSSIGCKVQLGTLAANAVYTELAEVRTVKLTIKSDNKAYVSSSTAGQTKRIKGNLDWSMAISVYTDSLATLIARNTINAFRVFVDSTEYWELLWGIFGEVSGIDLDREGAGNLGAQYNVSMAGFAEIGGSNTTGSITAPGASPAFWPAAS